MNSLFLLGRPRWVVGFVLVSATALSLYADVIYDNSANDSRIRFNPGYVEVGDELQLTGSARWLTNFSFEYWGTNSADPGNTAFGGNVRARVRFYLNDGPLFHGYATPGTPFYDSGWFGVAPTPRSTLLFAAGGDFPDQGLFLPASDFTWSVQFNGLGSTDSAGVDIFSPVDAGFSFPDYWQNDGTHWSLMTNGSGISINFACRLQATVAPSPPRPTLNIRRDAGQVLVTWPASSADYSLESSVSPRPEAAWTRINTGVVLTGGTLSFRTTIAAASNKFFRLHKP
jgi:hypothetical protein